MIIDLLNRLPFVLKKILPVVLLLGSLSLALAPKASAQMTLTITETDGNTTIAYSGSWETWSLSNNADVDPASISVYSGAFFNRPVGQDAYSNAIGYADDGTWSISSYFSGVRVSGSDSFGFFAFGRTAPLGYSAGDPISGSVLFSGVTIADLGLPAESGVINMTGGAAGISWTTSASAVPEPSTYGAIFGAIALGGAACRRRSRSKRAA